MADLFGLLLLDPPQRAGADRSRQCRPACGALDLPVSRNEGAHRNLANRGVAILGDKLFVATGDAHLLALSADSGTLQWDATLADYKAGYFITGAPLVVRDLVVIGVSMQPLGRGSSRRMKRAPARSAGAFTPSRDRASRVTRPGKANPGAPGVVPPGS